MNLLIGINHENGVCESIFIPDHIRYTAEIEAFWEARKDKLPFLAEKEIDHWLLIGLDDTHELSPVVIRDWTNDEF